MNASAPGSLMLLGEHAVLHGRRSLVCAINQRMRVSRANLSEPRLRIISDLGIYESSFESLEDHPDFRFVLDVVRQYSFDRGVELTIESDFSSDIGFGSSAAVTVATHAVLMGRIENRMELFKRALATVHRVQGRGSGADVAASVFGGVVAYRSDPCEIQHLPETFLLTAVYSGSKMKTADVIRHLEERRSLNADYFERIFDRMDSSVEGVQHDFSRLGEMLNLNQKLMEEMGLCNEALAEIIQTFGQLKVPAKISGSGLGDCAIGLGPFSDDSIFPSYALEVAESGADVSPDE